MGRYTHFPAAYGLNLADAMPIRHIIHADLDAFYAAVEQLDDPRLRGRPVLVGGSPEGRGVVTTASYEAREYGAHSAMPMATAVRLCPQGVVVSPRFPRYRELSQAVMSIFLELTHLVEPLSLDEAYLDITQVVGQGRFPLTIALDLKQRVMADTGLAISIGVSTCKSVAKIASDLDKPDGLVVVAPGDEATFLAPLPVSKLPGIGPKTVGRLKREDIETIGQLAQFPQEWFLRSFGKRGTDLRAKARGQDQEEVHTERAAKSVSSETTFSEDIHDPERLHQELAGLAGRVARQLASKDRRCRTVTVKLRLADFTTFTRQSTLPAHTQSEEVIAAVARDLLTKELHSHRAFRLLGVGASNFELEGEPERQLELPLFQS